MPHDHQKWTVRYANNAVRKEMRKQPELIRAAFISIRELIENEGLHKIPSHYIKKIQGIKKSQPALWEIRLSGKNTQARALFLKIIYRRVIIVRVFTKKSQNTPLSEIRLALKRAKEIPDD